MERRRGGPANTALWVIALAAGTSICGVLLATVPGAALSDEPEQGRGGSGALRYGPAPTVPTPDPAIKVSLPVANLDNTVPIETVLVMPVTTTNLDPILGCVGFQGDFTFDETVLTFSPPFVAPAGLTSAGWNVGGNILDGPGPIRTLRVSAFSPDFTPLNGAGVLYNLRLRRVNNTPATTTRLGWRIYPNGFVYIDSNLREVIPTQSDGRITITGIGPTATPTPVPVPTPCRPKSQNFDNVFNLSQASWAFRNNCVPPGESTWFQGDSRVFAAQSGGPNAYIAANFRNGAGLATISNWMLSPPLDLHDGATLTFYTRTVVLRSHPDRLQVRMSTNGTSVDVGETATSVGDFTTLLLDINPNYTTTGYPNIWTQFTAVVSGLGSRTTGRIAFRYFVENGGPNGPNSDFIGIDTLRFISCGAPTPTPTPAPPTPTPAETCPPVITQSTSQVITVNNSIACAEGAPFHYHFDNSYWRAFNMWQVTGGQPYYVSSVSFGIESARANPSVGTQPIEVRLYGQTSGEFPGGTRTQLVATTISVADQAGTVLYVPLAATVPAGTTQLIMEVAMPDGQAPARNSFFIGSNTSAQDGPSYLSTQGCDYPEPTDLALLGFPDMHLVFNIQGGCTEPTPSPGAHAINLSTRLKVGINDQVGVSGFIVTGSEPKQVLVRGIGPSLSSGGVQNPLADPVLELHGSSLGVITNDNWKDTQQSAINGTGIAPTNDLESAILATLNPGAYSAILRGSNNGTGGGLIEIYDLNPGNESRLANVSTRGYVGTGGDIVIAGLILSSGFSDAVISIRGIGPSLTASGVPDALANPALEIRNRDGVVLASNDDWQNGPPVTLPPGDPRESVIEATLSAGAYTALLFGVNGTTGVGLVEVYDRGSP